MAQTKDFTVRVPLDVYNRLQKMADAQYTSVASVVRQILSAGAKAE